METDRKSQIFKRSRIPLSSVLSTPGSLIVCNTERPFRQILCRNPLHVTAGIGDLIEIDTLPPLIGSLQIASEFLNIKSFHVYEIRFYITSRSEYLHND